MTYFLDIPEIYPTAPPTSADPSAVNNCVAGSLIGWSSPNNNAKYYDLPNEPIAIINSSATAPLANVRATRSLI